ncbi:3-keto-steroid reductase [Dendryphion nanum]|uniref:3-keto-steroid reductase n=1 Tax=Dendryphion nanum TaxID=256645 RepID=A0A9P9EE40_9PLEO|nr:3-keto-steroid reductase [Dendryphion nanum]
MATTTDLPQREEGFYVVITGANSGVGFAIGCRLIDEFLQTHPQEQSLVLIITTRNKSKGDATIKLLKQHLDKVCRRFEVDIPGVSALLQRRVIFRQEVLDLSSLISIQKLSKRLHETVPKLDAVICNAGIGGWEGVNFGKAIWLILTDWKNAMTWPTFKRSGVGWRTKPQITTSGKGKEIEEPVLGDVFCANLFGHYCFGHYLAPLLANHARSEHTRGRLIWVSSLEAYDYAFDLNDFQGLSSTQPYESSKRLTDLLAISSTFPSTAPLVDQYLGHTEDTAQTTKPRIYISHPGICGTSIMTLNVILEYLMFLAMYIARWLGSEWHTVEAYKGACSMVWLVLAKQSTLDAMESQEGVGKWGSATDWWGRERVDRTEVDGWGWGGILGEKTRKKGRHPHAKDLSKEDKQTFEKTGKSCWAEMEKLRLEWEARLNDAGVGVRM